MRHRTKTTFNKGHPAWNKQNLTAICQVCGKEYRLNNYRLQRGSKYCSKECKDEGWSRSRPTARIIELFREGKTAREISELVGRKLPSVYWALNTRKFRFRNGDLCTTTKRKHFLQDKKCMICGFDRIIEAAHIVPASKGGKAVEENYLALCPNHHKLFDRGLLTEYELLKIKEKLDVAKCKP